MIAHLDCTSGISGDKLLGALLGAGAPLAEVRSALDSLEIGAVLMIEPATRRGIAGLSVTIGAPPSPPHRAWADIRELLTGATLPGRARELAIASFERLATAEATVHGTTPDEVHFHEVGAVDSIADVVCACVAFELLGIERLTCSPIALGHGTVETAHGTLPVPAPATAELLRDVPVYAGPDESEMTTPTGAALVRTLASDFGGVPPMLVRAIGYGAGSRETATPNVARLLLGEAAAPVTAAEEGATPVVLLATNLDHISAEHAAFAAEELLAAGALDVWQVPIVMKKGRAGVELRMLCAAGDEARFAAQVAQLTGTLGVRIEPTTRFVQPRACVERETRYRSVRFKAGPDGRLRPEHDDVARIARECGLPYDRVVRELAEDAEDGARNGA
jgi:hypothetical protein